jgi:hypothetical protein
MVSFPSVTVSSDAAAGADEVADAVGASDGEGVDEALSSADEEQPASKSAATAVVATMALRKAGVTDMGSPM